MIRTNISTVRPIFLIGCGRSGTTILYQLLAGHPDLGWFSNYNDRFINRSAVSMVNRLFRDSVIRKRFSNTKGFPIPSEGYALWNSFHPEFASLGSKRLTEADAKFANAERMHEVIDKVLRYAGGSRFLNKNTRNSRRLRYLLALFPDANFVHIVRDGRAVVNSLTKVDWWTNLPVWWADSAPVCELRDGGMEEIRIAARFWRLETSAIMEDKNHVDPSRYIEVRYEDLIAQHNSALKRIMTFTGLNWSDTFERHIKSFRINDQNRQWPDEFAVSDYTVIEDECGELLKRLNYL